MSDKSFYELVVNGEVVYDQPIMTGKLAESLAELSFGMDSLRFSFPPKKTQEEINAEWRPWWDSLTPVEIEALAGRCGKYYWERYGAEVLSGDEKGNCLAITFPEKGSETLWKSLKVWVEHPSNFLPVLLRRIPAMNKEVEFPCRNEEYPCGCGCGVLVKCEERSNYIYNVIMHLNDTHRWTYEQVADWLDTLGVDFSFPMPDTITGP